MPASNEELALWAANFLALQSHFKPIFTAGFDDVSPAAITTSALSLLRAVDSGGVPAFMTRALRQIALDNNIALTPQSTPNEVIDALRARCTTTATTHTTNFD